MPDPTRDRLTGKYGYIRVDDYLGGARTKIPFVSWVASMTTVFADRTSTRNFSKDTNIVYQSSAPVARSMKVDVVGRYHRSSTPSTIVAQLYANKYPYHVALGFSPLDPYVDMYAWIEKFETAVTAEDVVNFTCTLRSEGEITDTTESGVQQNPPAAPGAGPEDA